MVDHILTLHNELGEGPLWDDRQQVLYWGDLANHRFFCWDPATGDVQMIQVDQALGCLALHEAGGLILAMQDGIAYWQDETINLQIDRESFANANRFNDGAVDRAGRFWIGTASDAADNHLYRIDSDGAVTRMIDRRMISNGIGWSPDDRTMYYSDSGGGGIVYAYDFDLTAGAISNQRVFLPPTPDGAPSGSGGVADGLTVDSEGCLWIAFWDGWRVERRAPSGELLQTIKMPVQRPTSCIFGGPDLRDLYVTSAAVGIDLNEQPQAGDLFRIRTDVAGLPEPRCKLALS